MESKQAANALIKLSGRGLDSLTEEERFLKRNARRERVGKLTLFFENSSSTEYCPVEERIRAAQEWAEKHTIELDCVQTGSLGLISESPTLGIQRTGRSRVYYGSCLAAQIPVVLDAFKQQVPLSDHLLGQVVLAGQHPWEGIPPLKEHGFFKQQERRLLNLSGLINPGLIADYLAWDGYMGFMKCIRYYVAQDIINLIEASGLRGRSGSGYPAYMKWAKAMSGNASKRYVICNGDESDPGSFMHRLLMEGNPHIVLEGVMIAAYTIGATEAIIHTRSRYKLAVKLLQQAINQAKQVGLLGVDILGSGYSLDVVLRRSPGAYVCGEETALIASLEGKRGMPRNKPPYPSSRGLFGQPTLVQSIETLASVPLIISKGPDWFRQKGTEDARGTKLFSLSGRVKRKGVVEVPFGISLRTVVQDLGGGCLDDQSIKAVLTAGPAGSFIPPDKMDVAVDYETFVKEGFVLGSGSLLALTESVCLVKLTCQMMEFICQESCGKCIPCREGSRHIHQVLKSLTEPAPHKHKNEALKRFKGVMQLGEVAEVMQETSLCGLGKSATLAVTSLLAYYRKELEEHVFDRKCKAHVCRNLLDFRVDPGACTGCHICFQKCPEDAIVGSPRQVHYILTDVCTGCGTCAEVCKFNAVIVS